MMYFYMVRYKVIGVPDCGHACQTGTLACRDLGETEGSNLGDKVAVGWGYEYKFPPYK